jgi:hypothetical protein
MMKKKTSFWMQEVPTKRFVFLIFGLLFLSIIIINNLHTESGYIVEKINHAPVIEEIYTYDLNKSFGEIKTSWYFEFTTTGAKIYCDFPTKEQCEYAFEQLNYTTKQIIE